MSTYKPEINSDARNPLWSGSARLDDIKEGSQVVSFDTRQGKTRVITFGTKWYLKEIEILFASNIDFPTDRRVGSYLALVANDNFGRKINLAQLGVYPFVENGDEWHKYRFSVPAQQEPIIRLCSWLDQEGYERSASELRDTFLEFFTDDYYWTSLLRHTQP